MQNFRNRIQAMKVVGGLSEPSKMPCWGFSLPATECKIGQKLRNVQGSVCSKCYALKGRYVFNEVKAAMYRRHRKLFHPRWVDAMVFLTKKHSYFRWHDSGDIQSVAHLKRIALVAKHTPNTLHWLPTREYAFVKQFCETNKVPKNLIIRLSAHQIDGPAPELLAKSLGVNVSGVSTTSTFNCPAPKQGNACLNCRACWYKRVWNVTYHKH
jgi:hypothetical protein